MTTGTYTDEVLEKTPHEPRYPGEPIEPRAPLALARINWGAVRGGAMVSMGVQALFVTFGLFIAFAAWNPATKGVGAGLTVWSCIWFWVTSIVSLFIGGYATGRMERVDPQTGGWNGLVTWGLTTIFTTVFLAWAATGALASVGTASAAAATNAANPGGTHTGWEVMLLLWIGILIGAVSAWSGGKKASRSLNSV